MAQGGIRFPEWLVWLIVIILTLLIAIASSYGGFLVPVLIVIMVFAIPLVLSILVNRDIGVYLMVVIAFFLNVLSWNFQGIPFGIMIDLFIMLMMLSLIYKCYLQKEWSVFKTPISGIVLTWGLYNLLQLFNPEASSRVAWFYVMRPALGYLMMYFLTSSILVSYQAVTRFLGFFVLIATLDGFWGIYQSFFGYLPYEMAWVYANDAVHLVFNYGKWRSFGTIGSPAQYGIIMCITFLMTISFVKMWQFRWKKWLMWISVFTCFMATIYSGTRSAYVIIPLYIFVNIILSRNFKMYGLIVVMVAGLFVLANVESNNWYVQRIQSVFKANEDKSFQVREENRTVITPYIMSHPFGAGLGSTGVWGQRFSPGTWLAEFPPDSGLIRVGVELGWVGLVIFVSLYLWVLIKSTLMFWTLKTKRYNKIVPCIISAIAPLLLIETSQEVVGVYPMSLLFWILLAVLFRSLALAKKEDNMSKIEF